MSNTNKVNLDLKREQILKHIQLYADDNFIKAHKKLSGRGIYKKLARIFRFPYFYIPIFFYKFSKFFSFKLEAEKGFFNFRKLKLPLYDFNSYLILTFNFIPLIEEIKLTKFLVKNLSQKDIFYDIGENYGYYTYLALEFCKEVHSFEPIPDVFRYLSLNLQDQGNVFLNNVALTDVEGEVDIYYGTWNTGLSTLNKILVNNRENLFGGKIKIKTITLDQYLQFHNKPTVVKIDVEGSEYLVLKGGSIFFKDCAPLIIIEILGEPYYGNVSSKSISFLFNLGYKAFKINYDGEILEANLQDLKEGGDFIFQKL